MNQEIKAKWIAALRSGEYKQTRFVLNDKTGMCCLGVLCDLHNKEEELEWTFNPVDVIKGAPELKGKSIGFSGNSCVVPNAVVCEWAGLAENNPYLLSIAKHVMSNGEEITCSATLAELNDAGLTFDQMADVINYFL